MRKASLREYELWVYHISLEEPMTSSRTSGVIEEAKFQMPVKILTRTRLSEGGGSSTITPSTVVPLSLPLISPTFSPSPVPSKLIRINTMTWVEQALLFTLLENNIPGGASSPVRGFPLIPPLPCCWVLPHRYCLLYYYQRLPSTWRVRWGQKCIPSCIR